MVFVRINVTNSPFRFFPHRAIECRRKNTPLVRATWRSSICAARRGLYANSIETSNDKTSPHSPFWLNYMRMLIDARTCARAPTCVNVGANSLAVGRCDNLTPLNFHNDAFLPPSDRLYYVRRQSADATLRMFVCGPWFTCWRSAARKIRKFLNCKRTVDRLSIYFSNVLSIGLYTGW